jgi:hypothetical protein
MPKFGSRFSSFKKSYMVLRFGFLVFYGSMDARSPTGTIDLADVNSIDQLDDEPLTLALSLTQKEIKLRFVSPDEMWVFCWQPRRVSLLLRDGVVSTTGKHGRLSSSKSGSDLALMLTPQRPRLCPHHPSRR